MLTAVTGATGFLGKAVCAALVARGEDVIAIGRDFSKFDIACEKRVADLRDAGALGDALAGATHVIHGAAIASPWGPWSEFVRVNVEGTRSVVTFARASGVKRLVHVSSSTLAFDGRDRTGIKESDPMPEKPLGKYARSKRLAEQIVREATDLETVILRPRAIFGPGDNVILPRLITMARSGRLRIIGDGKNRADLTYIDNVVDAVILARDVRAAAGKTFFLSNDAPIPVWELVRRVCEGLSIPPPTKRVPFPVALAIATGLEATHTLLPFLGEPRLTRYAVTLLARDVTLDISLAKKELGYAPRISMDEGITRTIAAFRPATL